MDVYAIRAPLVGDAWEVPGGPHLVGHPTSRRSSTGSRSAATRTPAGRRCTRTRCTARARSRGPEAFPRIRPLPSSTIVTIISGRGYVW
jgi:hypothetical protein